jgi:Restriction endonuclease
VGDWKQYEAYVVGSLERLLPGAKIRHDVHLQGLKSGRQRQIDVLVERDFGGFRLAIAVDCKHYSRRINVNGVEQFLGMLDDLRVSKGVMITTKGYSQAAHDRARNETRDIELRIMSPERLSEFQHIGCALAWKGPVAAVVSPPEAWVVDNEATPGGPPCQFSMYPLGHTRESAMRFSSFLYGTLVLKFDKEPTMEAIARRHEAEILATNPAAKIERMKSRIRVKSKSGLEKPLLRIAWYLAFGPEFSLYLDHPKGVLVLVLLCPAGQEEQALTTLEWVGKTAVLMDCEQR